jgi:hypothetical protein
MATRLEEWIALCPDGVITWEIIEKAKALMATQRAGKTAADEPTPIESPANEGTMGDGIGGAGEEGDGIPIEP